MAIIAASLAVLYFACALSVWSIVTDKILLEDMGSQKASFPVRLVISVWWIGVVVFTIIDLGIKSNRRNDDDQETTV